MAIDYSVFRLNQKSGLKQTDPRAFTAGAAGLHQLGQGLQTVGDAGAKFALAEQNAFNAMHMTRSAATRKIETGKLRDALLNPQIFNAHTYEQQYNNGIKKINEALVKVAPNSRLKALVGAEGLEYHATQSSTIAKEARVFRVKQLRADGLKDVRDLRAAEIAQDNTATGLLKKKEYQESIKLTLERMVAGNIIDPAAAQVELDKLEKDRQQGALRRALQTAESEEEYDELLGRSNLLDEQEKEIFLEKYRIKKIARDKFAIAQEERAWKLSERERTLKHRKHDAEIRSRANDPNPDLRPTDKELDDLLEKDLISVDAYNSVQNDILNPPKRTVETNGESYQKVLDKIEKPAKDRTIDAAEIWAIKDIADTDKRALITILRSIDDKGVKKGRQIMADVIGTPETFIALRKPNLIAQVKTLKREFYDRVQDGEDPVEVANDITEKWKNASDLTSGVSQNRTGRDVGKLPLKYRIYSDTNSGLKFPDTLEIYNQAVQDFTNGDITSQEFLDITNQVQLLEETWSREAQEKHGGRKTAATLKRERRERAEQDKIAKEQEAKKLEEQQNSLVNKAKEAASDAVESVVDTAKDSLRSQPEVSVDNRNLGTSREQAEAIQAKERREREHDKEIAAQLAAQLAAQPADEVLPDVEQVITPILEQLKQVLPDIKLPGSSEVPVDNRNPGKDRQRAEQLQEKARRERQRDKKLKDEISGSAHVHNSLPGGIENISLEKLKRYAIAEGHNLRKSERKKLTALLKKKGVTGNALKELEEQISRGLTQDN